MKLVSRESNKREEVWTEAGEEEKVGLRTKERELPSRGQDEHGEEETSHSILIESQSLECHGSNTLMIYVLSRGRVRDGAPLVLLQGRLLRRENWRGRWRLGATSV